MVRSAPGPFLLPHFESDRVSGSPVSRLFSAHGCTHAGRTFGLLLCSLNIKDKHLSPPRLHNYGGEGLQHLPPSSLDSRFKFGGESGSLQSY